MEDLIVPEKILNLTSLPPTSIKQTYKKVPFQKQRFLGYIVAVRDCLNFHIDIFFKDSKECESSYENVSKYSYLFTDEEAKDKEIKTRTCYACHLKGVELVKEKNNTKIASIEVNKFLCKNGGWCILELGDIDVYNRILVTIYNIPGTTNLNEVLLNYKNSENEPIAKTYKKPISRYFCAQGVENTYLKY